jgi:hypothetical protein
MAVATPTLDQVLSLAHQLPREQRGQLIAHLALELATEAPPQRSALTPEQTRAAWARLRTELSARPVGASSMAEQLGEDRRERDEALMGQAADEADNVHP